MFVVASTSPVVDAGWAAPPPPVVACAEPATGLVDGATGVRCVVKRDGLVFGKCTSSTRGSKRPQRHLRVSRL